MAKMGDSASTSNDSTAAALVPASQDISAAAGRLRVVALALLALLLAPVPLALGAAPQVALLDEGPEHVHDRASAELRRHVRDVVGRGDLHHLHAADPLARDGPQRLQRLTGQQASRLRRARARHEARVDRVDVEGEEDRLGVLPRALERDIHGLLDPQLLDVDRKSTRLNSSHTVISYAVF